MIGKEWLMAHLPSGIKNHSMEGEDEALAKLAELGEEGAPVIKEIAAALADPNEYVRRRAATALGRLGEAGAAAAGDLAAALKDPDETVRSRAAESLGQMGEAGAAHADAVAALLEGSVRKRPPCAPRALWRRWPRLAPECV